MRLKVSVSKFGGSIHTLGGFKFNFMSFADTEVPRDPKLTCSPDGITRDDCAVERNQVHVNFRLAQHFNQNPQ